MKNIKKFNELFDTPELRDQNEIPQLKGEFENIPSWKKVGVFDHSDFDKETSKSMSDRIIFRYPILDKFHINHKQIQGQDVYCFYATSFEPLQGSNYYAQIVFYYSDNFYNCSVLFRELEDMNEDNWQFHTFGEPSIEDSYKIVDAFLKTCKSLNIIMEDNTTFFNN